MDDVSKRAKRRYTPDARRSSYDVLDLLSNGDIELLGLVPWSSNYTYQVRVRDRENDASAIYKPSCGERPLWDFETGTLCQREVAAYLVSVELGWPNVPVTVLRDGPMGIGAVQQFIEFRRRENFFTIRDRYPDEMQKIAAFDALINNTDRKGGHILVDHAGSIWCIDHGVTFHEEPKLRTVIWDFIGEPIPENLLLCLRELQSKLRSGDPVQRSLSRLLSHHEMRSMEARLAKLLQARVYPEPPEDWPHIPWPPV